LALQKGTDPFRFQLPVPLTAYGFLDASGKLTHNKHQKAQGTRVSVHNGKGISVPANMQQIETIQPHIDQMKRKALQGQGFKKKDFDFWFD
jgi:hypothetical protein